MKKLTKTPKLLLSTEKVRDLAPLSDETLRGIAGGGRCTITDTGGPGGSSHTTGG